MQDWLEAAVVLTVLVLAITILPILLFALMIQILIDLEQSWEERRDRKLKRIHDGII